MKLPPADSELGRLMATLPRPGRVEWIGIRPARDKPMQEVAEVEAGTGGGLSGDRYRGGSGKRGVTLIQAEHLPVIAALSGHASVEATDDPSVQGRRKRDPGPLFPWRQVLDAVPLQRLQP